MHDTLQIMADSYIALTAACTVTGLASYIYGINKAYYDAEDRVLKNRKLSYSSKKMAKNIKNEKRKFVFKESLKTFIPVYHIYNSVINLVERDKFYQMHYDYFTSRFEDVNDNEKMNKSNYIVSKAVKKYIYKD